jgi:hypothetical protein
VLEATILATRLHLLDSKTVSVALDQHDEIVRKTGGEVERAAIQRVREFVGRWTSDHRG